MLPFLCLDLIETSIFARKERYDIRSYEERLKRLGRGVENGEKLK